MRKWEYRLFQVNVKDLSDTQIDEDNLNELDGEGWEVHLSLGNGRIMLRRLFVSELEMLNQSKFLRIFQKSAAKKELTSDEDDYLKRWAPSVLQAFANQTMIDMAP